MEDIDGAAVLVDGVDDPILGTPTEAIEIGAIGCAGEREVGPCQRCVGKVDRENSIEPVDLLEGKGLTVVTKPGGEFVDMSLRERRDAQTERHAALRFLLAAVYAD